MKTKEDINIDFASVYEVSQILGVNTSRVAQLLRLGVIAGAFKLGHAWLVPRASLQKYLEVKKTPKKRDKISSREILENALKEMNEGR